MKKNVLCNVDYQKEVSTKHPWWNIIINEFSVDTRISR